MIEKDLNDVFIDEDSNISHTIYGSLNGKYQVGETVKILNYGKMYSSYDSMIKAMNINELTYDVNNGEKGIVFSRKIHGDNNIIVYGVRLLKNNKSIVIGESGLKKCLGIWLDDSLFEI